MNKIIFLLAVLSSSGFCAKFDLDQLRARFRVRGEVFVLDSSGKRLLERGGEWRDWEPRDKSGKLESRWSGESDGGPPLAIHHLWQIQDDGTIKVTIEQYAKVVSHGRDEGPEFQDLVRREEMVLENFAPITWVVRSDKEKRMVLRFTPSIDPDEGSKALTALPISGSDITVSDDLGNVWSTHLTIEDLYFGLVTHRGTIFISYYPFKGSKELGWAKDRRMELRLTPKLAVTLHSETAFLPAGVKAKVYGVYQEGRRTAKIHSEHLMGSSREEDFLEKISRH
jgi:hypothetical protein